MMIWGFHGSKCSDYGVLDCVCSLVDKHTALKKHVIFTFRPSELHTSTLRVEAACSSETLIYLEYCKMSLPRNATWNFSIAFILGNLEKKNSQLE